MTKSDAYGLLWLSLFAMTIVAAAMPTEFVLIRVLLISALAWLMSAAAGAMAKESGQ